MIRVNGIEFKEFPNGETNIVANNSELIWATFDLKYESDADLFKLYLAKKHVDTLSIHSRKILRFSYFPYSRMDRVEGENCFSLKHVCDFINSLNFDKVVVVEAHSNVTLALLNNVKHVMFTDRMLINKTFPDLGFNKNGDYYVFPDYGAFNRLKDMQFDEEFLLIANKKRNFETGKIEKLEIIGTPKNPKRALILDDLSSYGGTFVMCAKALRELGFKEVYLQVPHAENSVLKGELFNHIDKLYTTDSILDRALVEQSEYKDKIDIVKWEALL